MKDLERRSFLKISGAAIGIGVLYQVAPLASAEAAETFRLLGRHSGEAVTPFSFVQLSDAHVGFNGPPDPLGTKAFERAVEMVNALPQQPDLVLFTGDLTHDSEDKDVHSKRMRNFREIAGRLKTKKLMCVPGEHDAGLDGGALFRDNFGPTHYSFDHRGVHFIALDNVSRAKPEVGTEQIAWLKSDLARFSKSTPIVLFTHRPLFDLKPEWEWFTSDGDDVMNTLAGYENVTVLYGHIHTDHDHQEGHVRHLAARSLIFAFPEPTAPVKKPYPFDKDQPFKHLGIRVVSAAPKRPIAVQDVELTLREYSGLNGIQQILKSPKL
ncbi:MAG: metallophosphoesterase [Acidobacteriia bacterium]|nr:metallophosphoesterase [Terriglobia bacterium]